MAVDKGIQALHISNIINALIGWILPWSIVHGIITLVLLQKLKKEPLVEFHRENQTNFVCLIITCTFSFLWSFLWAIGWFSIFFLIFPLVLGVICCFGSTGSLYLMMYRE